MGSVASQAIIHERLLPQEFHLRDYAFDGVLRFSGHCLSQLMFMVSNGLYDHMTGIAPMWFMPSPLHEPGLRGVRHPRALPNLYGDLVVRPTLPLSHFFHSLT